MEKGMLMDTNEYQWIIREYLEAYIPINQKILNLFTYDVAKEGLLMVNKYLKKYSTFLVFRKIQMKSALRFHFTLDKWLSS
jgi:hypothetical protein